MIISCPADSADQIRPQRCVCNNRRFHRNGSYWRKIAWVLVYQFLCTACGKHVTIVPSGCVPHKHHPTSTIQSTLDSVVKDGCSGYDLECANEGVHASCIYRWISEFSSNISLLATEGAKRLKVTPFSGSFKQIYQGLSEQYPLEEWLTEFQVVLCSYFPPLGIFRLLISGSG